MGVVFQDFSFKVKADLNEKTVEWLHETANEIAAQAARNCVMDGEVGNQLRGSYATKVNAGAGEAQVGSTLEAAYWEELGTGEYAVNGDGRKGWWVYKDDYKGNGGKVLTEAEAKAAAATDPTLHATNGRPPNYTLEKAFTTTKPKAIAALENKLRGL